MLHDFSCRVEVLDENSAPAGSLASSGVIVSVRIMDLVVGRTDFYDELVVFPCRILAKSSFLA